MPESGPRLAPASPRREALAARLGRRRLALALLAFVVLPAVLAGLTPRQAAAAARTTAPGQKIVIRLTLTNTAIIIPADKYSQGLKYPRYPRGGAIQYKVVNRGTRPYSLKIAGRATHVIAPGHSVSIQLNWTTRGRFLYETLLNGKPLGPKGYITIF